MKAVIWILCIAFIAVVQTVCRSSGIILGGIPTMILYGGSVYVAFTLCNAYDKRKGGSGAASQADKNDPGTPRF